MPTTDVTLAELLSRGIAEVIDKKHLERRLRLGTKLRVKYGIDPTGRDIHLGHAVPIRLLRRFQLLGHRVVFIVGDFTAMIGDPSGLATTRSALSFEETRENARNYFDQAFKILDRAETEIHYNSEWFHDFDLKKTIHLLSHSSVAQLLAHETFRLRLKKEQPFFAHEILYPLLQAYDSVAVRADVEVGGLDQKFNLLMGREVQRAFNQEPQDVVLTEYLLGTDGKAKMSKSLGNYIAITESPAEMFGKVMSIPDSLIESYFRLATDITDEALILIKKEMKGGMGKRDAKMRLAKTIVEQYHGTEAAEDAEDAWKTRFQAGNMPVADKTLPLKSGKYPLVDIFAKTGLATSKSDARRKLEQKAFTYSFRGNPPRIFNGVLELDWKRGGYTDLVLRLGRRFLEITPKK